jgi:hypothetical protein
MTSERVGVYSMIGIQAEIERDESWLISGSDAGG